MSQDILRFHCQLKHHFVAASKRQMSTDYWTNDAERVTQLESLIGPASAIEHPCFDFETGTPELNPRD